MDKDRILATLRQHEASSKLRESFTCASSAR
jgi:hypothetical protein